MADRQMDRHIEIDPQHTFQVYKKQSDIKIEEIPKANYAACSAFWINFNQLQHENDKNNWPADILIVLSC